MASSQLERMRVALSDIETADRLVVKDLEKEPKTASEQVLQDIRLKTLLDISKSRSKDILEQLKDKDGFRRMEVEHMSGPNVFPHFYEQLKETTAYHKKFNNNRSLVTDEERLLAEAKPTIKFSGAEASGRHLDLQAFYGRFVNLAAFKEIGKSQDEDEDKISYRAYLDVFSELDSVPIALKTESYLQYVTDLAAGLRSFHERSQPLGETARAKMVAQWKAELAAAEKAKEAGGGLAHLAKQPGYLDLSPFDSSDDMVPLGRDILKAAAQVLGIKSGGTVPQLAARLFSCKGKTPAEFAAAVIAGRPKKRRRKNKKKAAPADQARTAEQVAAEKAFTGRVAAAEFMVGKWCGELGEIINDTKKAVEQKQIKTYEEMQAEMQEQEEAEKLAAQDEASDSEEDDEIPYNPLNLPLGWDGKPIPYWLYKLHGLGVEFKCEICGNESYWGRRAFDRHFQEWRHAYGMRCLKIPNTKHFHDITLIEDAVNLYEKIKHQIQGEQWEQDRDEEFEDSEGNVLNKKTYEDLARQGLL